MAWLEDYARAVYGTFDSDAPHDVPVGPRGGERVGVEIREMMSEARKAEQEVKEVYRWLNSDRSEPLTPELKARLVDMVAFHFGHSAACKAMDQIATNVMPQVMQ